MAGKVEQRRCCSDHDDDDDDDGNSNTHVNTHLHWLVEEKCMLAGMMMQKGKKNSAM